MSFVNISPFSREAPLTKSTQRGIFKDTCRLPGPPRPLCLQEGESTTPPPGPACSGPSAHQWTMGIHWLSTTLQRWKQLAFTHMRVVAGAYLNPHFTGKFREIVPPSGVRNCLPATEPVFFLETPVWLAVKGNRGGHHPFLSLPHLEHVPNSGGGGQTIAVVLRVSLQTKLSNGYYPQADQEYPWPAFLAANLMYRR